MKKLIFSSAAFSRKRRITRREFFLSEIERVVPWQKPLDVISPHYRKGGKTGRPPISLERLRQRYLVQQCFALSDEGTEDALYGSQSIRSLLKDRLGMKNTRYRGLKKNAAQLFTLFGLANLLIAKRILFALEEGGAS